MGLFLQTIELQFYVSVVNSNMSTLSCYTGFVQKVLFSEKKAIRSGWILRMKRGSDINTALNHCKSALDMQIFT